MSSTDRVYVWDDSYFGIFSPGTYRSESDTRITMLVSLSDKKIGIEEDDGSKHNVSHAVLKRSHSVIIHCDDDFIAIHYFPVSMEYHSLSKLLEGKPVKEIAFQTHFKDRSWITDAKKGLADSPLFVRGCSALLKEVVGYKVISKKFDSRALHVTQRIRKEIPDVSPIEVYADDVGLSTSRLSHLFKESFDISIKTYALLEKMRKGLLLIVDGTAFTDASIQAGFADAAHFTRAIRKNFSLTPTTISNDIKVHVFK